MFGQSPIATLGLILIFSGLAVVFLSTILLVLTSMKTRGKAKGGGLIMIGPIPIIFGTDKESVKLLLILSVVLIGLVLALIIFLDILS